MRQRLLMDEDSQSRVLVSFLRAAGHDVLTVNEAGIAGSPDSLFQRRLRFQKIIQKITVLS